jgi:hypothetical protein
MPRQFLSFPAAFWQIRSSRGLATGIKMELDLSGYYRIDALLLGTLSEALNRMSMDCGRPLWRLPI